MNTSFWVRVFRSVQGRLFPTKQQRMVRKWYADGANKLRFEYDLDEHSLVLDVGGFDGQWASDLFSRYRCRIVVFEPVKAFAEAIHSRFSRNERIEVDNSGLGGRTRADLISVMGQGSSIIRPMSRCTDLEEIKIVDVCEWWQERTLAGVGLMKIDLMKINIEGAEYELLERLIETGLVAYVCNIQIQFHKIDRDSEQRMKKIHADLDRTHELTWQYEWVWENWRRPGRTAGSLAIHESSLLA